MGIVSQAPFNGGTITRPLVIAPTDHNSVALSIETSWNAQNADFFRVLNTDTGTRLFAVDVQGQTLAFVHTTESDPTLNTGGTTKFGKLPGLDARGASGATQVGFYEAVAISKQTGVPVTAAAIHAALVNLGLISA